MDQDHEISRMQAVLSTMDEDAFCAGPDRHQDWLSGLDAADPEDDEPELYDIDRIFGTSFTTVYGDAVKHQPDALKPVAGAPETQSDMVPGYRFREIEGGLLLVAPDGEIAGGYIGCDLALDEGHQGAGLGAELVLEYFLRRERIPIWDMDGAQFSPAGFAAHKAAHRMGQDLELVAKKVARIDAGVAPEAGFSMAAPKTG